MRQIPDSFEQSVVDEIDEELSAVAIEHQVALPIAVESGSRAWGFPSPDSDYDCRFVAGGDPWLDVARFGMSEKANMDAFLRGYLDGEDLSAEVRARISIYCLVWTTFALTWEFAVDGDWITPQVQRIAEQLSSLEGPGGNARRRL